MSRFDAFPLKLSLSPEDPAALEHLEDVLRMIEGGAVQFATRTDSRKGTLWLFGLDELDLDHLIHGLLTVHGIRMRVGAPDVNYRAVITGAGVDTYSREEVRDGTAHGVRIEIEVRPGDSATFEYKLSEELSDLDATARKAIKAGLLSGSDRGPLEGFPVRGVHATVRCVEALSAGPVALRVIEKAVHVCLHRALNAAGLVMEEPVMGLDIRVPETSLAAVTADLQARRGRVLETHSGQDGSGLLAAHVPMTNLLGYINALRQMTGGAGEFDAMLSHYQPVPGSKGPDDDPPMALAL